MLGNRVRYIITGLYYDTLNRTYINSINRDLSYPLSSLGLFNEFLSNNHNKMQQDCYTYQYCLQIVAKIRLMSQIYAGWMQVCMDYIYVRRAKPRGKSTCLNIKKLCPWLPHSHCFRWVSRLGDPLGKQQVLRSHWCKKIAPVRQDWICILAFYTRLFQVSQIFYTNLKT